MYSLAPIKTCASLSTILCVYNEAFPHLSQLPNILKVFVAEIVKSIISPNFSLLKSKSNPHKIIFFFNVFFTYKTQLLKPLKNYASFINIYSVSLNLSKSLVNSSKS